MTLWLVLGGALLLLVIGGVVFGLYQANFSQTVSQPVNPLTNIASSTTESSQENTEAGLTQAAGGPATEVPATPQVENALSQESVSSSQMHSAADPCADLPTIQFSPSSIEKNPDNSVAQFTLGVTNFPPVECKMDSRVIDPDGVDISKNFIFDIQNKDSFVLNSPANQNPGASSNVLNVVLNFAPYTAQFSKPGEYQLVFYNTGTNLQQGVFRIIVGNTPSSSSMQAVSAPSSVSAGSSGASPLSADCITLVGNANATVEQCDLARQLQGVITGSLDPARGVQRYEAALMVVRALHLHATCSDNDLGFYTDLNLKASYIDQLCTAVALGVIKGSHPDNSSNWTLAPSDPVTYRQFVRMLVNGYGAAGFNRVPRSYSQAAALWGFKVDPKNDWFGVPLQFLENRMIDLGTKNLDQPMTRMNVGQVLVQVIKDIGAAQPV